MKKSDLKNGAIVKTRNGFKYILINKRFINIKFKGFLPIGEYSEDLTMPEDEKQWDVMKVCQTNFEHVDFSDHVLDKNPNHWTWEREEEVVMTISEIEEKLGIKGLKIKKED